MIDAPSPQHVVLSPSEAHFASTLVMRELAYSEELITQIWDIDIAEQELEFQERLRQLAAKLDGEA